MLIEPKIKTCKNPTCVGRISYQIYETVIGESKFFSESGCGQGKKVINYIIIFSCVYELAIARLLMGWNVGQTAIFRLI